METKIYVIRNSETKVIMVVTYTNDSHGRDYMSYDRPTFTIEEPDKYNINCPIWTTNSADIASDVINGRFNGEDSITTPSIDKKYGENGLCDYEVFELSEIY